MAPLAARDLTRSRLGDLIVGLSAAHEAEAGGLAHFALDAAIEGVAGTPEVCAA